MSSKTVSKHPCVFILGMHRGGTSCLAGMLREYGLFLGDVDNEDPFNAKGNQEIREVRVIDNRLLGAAGGSWYMPAAADMAPPLLDLRIRGFRKVMEKENTAWGIKDPRMLYCLDAWFQPGDRLVGTFRHPAATAASLEARNRENPEHKRTPLSGFQWHELWRRYNCRLVELYERKPFPVVNFDWEARRYAQAVARMARRLGLSGESEDFFQPTLRHHRHTGDRDIADAAHRDLYRRLTGIAEAEEKKG
jgi:hypothetical protein